MPIIKPDFSGDIDQYLSSTEVAIRRNMATAGVNASGYTSKSIGYAAGTSEGTLYADQNLYNVESGTAPRDRGGIVSFYDIFEWMYAKGIAPADVGAAKAMAGAITRSILAVGTKTYQRGGRKDIFSNELDDTKKLAALSNEVNETSLDTLHEQLDQGNIWK